jgi:antitoxin (DNA-binding transcriptional repressor) of toxin-antitoxin stability system
MLIRPDVEFTIEDAKARFDALIDMVEEGKSVGILDKGELRGVLVPVISEKQVSGPVSGSEPRK